MEVVAVVAVLVLVLALVVVKGGSGSPRFPLQGSAIADQNGYSASCLVYLAAVARHAHHRPTTVPIQRTGSPTAAHEKGCCCE